jgi:hypothetical protein
MSSGRENRCPKGNLFAKPEYRYIGKRGLERQRATNGQTIYLNGGVSAALTEGATANSGNSTAR